VRELRNALEYAYVIGDGPTLLDVDLPPEVSGMQFDPDATAVNMPTHEHDNSPEAKRIRRALAHAEGSRERAAQILGISRVTLWRRMKSLGMTTSDEMVDD
jgi:DNA-binding NtrC family response regulator